MKKKRRNLVNDMKYHYTYRITNIKEKMYYYGVHSCDCLPKEDIGIKYWSSSKRDGFIDHQKQNPEQYKYKVLKIFNTRVEAVEHEMFLHKKFDVKLHEKFYNDSNQTSTGFDTSGRPGIKGYTAAKDINTGEIVYITTKLFYESDQYQAINKNLKLSDDVKKLLSKLRMGVSPDIKGLTYDEYYGEEKSNQIKQNLSVKASARLGELNAFYGKNHTIETKELIGSYSIGMAVYISETGENIRISVEEANRRGLEAESKGRKYSKEVNMKKGRSGKDNSMYGKTPSDEAKQKIKQSWHECRPKTLCTHCNKMILKAHNKFHFDNCKLRKPNEN